MPLDDKSRKRVSKLFSDLEYIANGPLEIESEQSQLPVPQLTNENLQLQQQVKELTAHIHELESQLQEAEQRASLQSTRANSEIIYEKENIGYTYHGNEPRPDLTSGATPSEAENTIDNPLPIGAGAIVEMQAAPSGGHNWKPEEVDLANAIAQQASLQIQNLRLLEATERARAEAQAATRQFTHQSWKAFMDGIRQNERIGYMYDQSSVGPFSAPTPDDHDIVETVSVMDEQVGNLFLKADPSRPLTDEDKALVSAVARQLGQQVENLRLLADASRARADAEEATRRLMHESWRSFTQSHGDAAMGFLYDSVKVSPLSETAAPQNITFVQPLSIRGEVIGQLAVAGWDQRSAEGLELANSIAEQVSIHIENLRLFEQNEKRARELGTVAAVSTTASTVLNPDELLQSVVDLTQESFNLYHAHIYLADESWNALLLAAGSGEVGRQMVIEGHTIQIDAEKSIVARATRERTAIIANDVRTEENFLPNPLLPETQAEMAVPMIVGDKVLGVFDVQSTVKGYFTEDDAKIYTTLAVQVAIALQNARLYVEQSATVAQLRELDRLKSSFLANMSHELRTPLNSILGFSDVMLEELDGPLTENMANDLGLIQKNGKHLLHLINDVLDMAKIESGRMNLMPEKFKVHEIIEEVTSITSTLASEKNLALFIEEESDQEVEITADRTRLRQIMINVVNNAIKFTEKGKVSIRVTPQSEQVMITVRDTGIGIPPDKLEAVFQEFTQVDTSSTRKAGGTGLGLPISRRLVEMHGGHLWAESTGIDGEGTTFFVELPIEAKLTEPVEKTSK